MRLSNWRMGVMSSPMPAQKPFVRFKVVLQQVLPFVRGLYLEIISPRPLRLAFHLVPTVEDFANLDGLSLADKSARRLISRGAGVALDLNRNQFHRPEAEP